MNVLQLVQKVKKTAVAKLATHANSNPAAYAELLKKLIIQGLIKLNESKVEVQCRQADVQLVKKVMEPAAREYERMILEACKETVKVEVVVSDRMLPETCAGGVKISAKYGRIVCDNTLDARLSIAFEDLMYGPLFLCFFLNVFLHFAFRLTKHLYEIKNRPVIRKMLFSSSV